MLIENGRYLAHVLFWEQRPGTVNLYGIMHAPTLAPYYSDARLARVGVTRQQVQSFFAQYQREGPLFESQASDGDGLQPVYRLVVRAP